MSRFRAIAGTYKKVSVEAFSEKTALKEGGETKLVPPPPLKKDILDQFLGLRDALLKNKNTPYLRIFGVTSSRGKEGTTTISICLALAFAMDTRMRVLLVDGNLREPAIHKFFRISKTPGLSDVIQDDRLIDATTVRITDSSLSVLPSGSVQSTPVELFACDSFDERITNLKRAFDVIIVDTPNFKQYPDLGFIGRSLEGVVLVVEADSTQLPLILETKDRIESANIRILGVTLNRVRARVPSFLNRYIGL
jgi:capsular exopolysaccharide synthesis family protein